MTAFVGASMRINQDITLQEDAALSAAVAERDKLLEATINGSAAEATWYLNTWDRNGNGRWQQLVLHLKDDRSGSRSSATISPADLKSETGFLNSLNDLKAALAHVREWRKTIDELFARVRPWCVSLPGQPAVCGNVDRVSEEKSGEYLVRQLFVIRDGRLMVIHPVAAWVVGWDGRVDLDGVGGPLTLLYSRPRAGWFHYRNTMPIRPAVPMTEELFRELAEACLDG